MGYTLPKNVDETGTITDGRAVNIGRGASQSIGTGFDLGLAYKLGAMTFGFNYQTPIAMEYKHQLENAANDFQASSELDSDKLTQPSEMALGFTYDAGKWLVTVDYRTIGWSSAAGYEEFGWEDQTVIALGGAYTMGKNIFRLGYSTANNPLGDDAIKNDTMVGMQQGPRNSFNFLNAVGFPATITSHISLGYTREFSKRFSLDLAYVTANGESSDIEFMGPTDGGPTTFEVTSTHSQSSFTVGGRWVF